jgi:hypothetical protein
MPPPFSFMGRLGVNRMVSRVFKFLLILPVAFCFLAVLSVDAHAGLPNYVWNTATGSWSAYAVTNNRAFLAEADLTLIQMFARDAAQITRPSMIKGINTLGIGAAEMFSISGATSAGAMILRRGIAIAGPVATVVTLAMTAKEIYDWSQKSAENKAFFDGRGVLPDELKPFSGTVGGSYIVSGSLPFILGPKLITDTMSSPWHLDGCYRDGANISCVKFPKYEMWQIIKEYIPEKVNITNGNLQTFTTGLNQAFAEADPNLSPYPQAKEGIDLAMTQSLPSVKMAPTAAEIGTLAAKDAVTAAQTAQTTNITNNIQEAKDKLLENPTDLALKEKVDALQRELDKAIADKAKNDLEQAEQAKKDAEAVPTASTPDLKAIDFTPLLGLSGVLSGKFPFNMFSQVAGFITLFAGDGSAPKFIIPFPMGMDMNVDLAPFDPIASVMRFTLAVLLSIGSIFYVVRRFV